MRDFRNNISSEEIDYCQGLILNFLTTYLEKDVFYQGGSGIEAAISTLPYILKDEHFNQKVTFKNPAVIYLFFLLHNGNENRMAVSCFSNIMWSLDSAIAKKLFSAVVLLKDQYNSQVLHYQGISKNDFLKRHNKEIKEILNSKHDIDSLDYSTISYDSLLIISSMMECGCETDDSNLSQIHSKIWEQIFKNNRDRDCRNINYDNEHMYLKWLALHLLSLDTNTIPSFVDSLIPYFTPDRNTETLLANLIFKEDVYNHYKEFWAIWNSLFLQIETLCEKSKAAYLDIEHSYYTGDLDEVVITYALAFHYWGDKIKSWHSLRADNIEFYQQLSLKLGYVPVVLYSITKVLNTVGYDFLDEGIEWIYNIVNLNNHLWQRELFINTLYYMEEYMQRYLYVYKDELRKSPDKRNKVIRILDFLVSRGSVCGFMLREEIA